MQCSVGPRALDLGSHWPGSRSKSSAANLPLEASWVLHPQCPCLGRWEGPRVLPPMLVSAAFHRGLHHSLVPLNFAFYLLVQLGYSDPTGVILDASKGW